MFVWLGYFIVSFLASLLTIVIVLHFHLEHLWEERHRQIEMRRAQRKRSDRRWMRF